MNIGSILQAKGRGSYTVPPGTPLEEVIRGMRDRNVGFVMVMDHHGELKGVVSERDVVHCLASRGHGGFGARVEEIMTRDVATCDSSADAQAAVELMGRRRVRHLPVLAEGKLVGVLSSRDILAYLAEHAPMEEIAQLWTRAARL